MDRRSHLLVIVLIAATIIGGRIGTTLAVGHPIAVRGFHYVLVPDPERIDPMLNRSYRQLVVAPTPLPTPVAPPPAPKVYVAKIVGNGMLLWPVPGGHITQYFSSWHPALDIAAPAGRPVIAAAAGIVIWVGWKSNGGGLQVYIDHGHGLKTYYNHLGSILVSLGEVVTAGQEIARVGCTGTCTGPHVHFVVVVNGVYVNPLRYL